MSGWRWVQSAVALAIHDEQLSDHGGATGVRDRGALEAAIARPITLSGYAEVDIAALSAAYAWGIARNHPFVDGNKRTALVVAELFLALNGHALDATDAECVLTFLSLAAGDIDEAGLAGWFRERIVAR